MTENELSRVIVDSAFKIHTTLGPGLFESVYEVTMGHELQRRGCLITHQRELQLSTRTSSSILVFGQTSS
jgi:GxxExxY protein